MELERCFPEVHTASEAQSHSAALASQAEMPDAVAKVKSSMHSTFIMLDIRNDLLAGLDNG